MMGTESNSLQKCDSERENNINEKNNYKQSYEHHIIQNSKGGKRDTPIFKQRAGHRGNGFKEIH